MLRDHRVHYAGIVTELSFTQDPSIAFPKIEFNYVKSLSDDEARVIIEMREHEQVDRILHVEDGSRRNERRPRRSRRPTRRTAGPAASRNDRAPVPRVPASCVLRRRSSPQRRLPPPPPPPPPPPVQAPPPAHPRSLKHL